MSNIHFSGQFLYTPPQDRAFIDAITLFSTESNRTGTSTINQTVNNHLTGKSAGILLTLNAADDQARDIFTRHGVNYEYEENSPEQDEFLQSVHQTSSDDAALEVIEQVFPILSNV